MKKIILSVVFAAAIFTVQAQTKVTKTSVVGKWPLAAMKVEGMLYYDIAKDSISLGEAILTQLKAAGQDSAGAAEMMKGQFEALKEVSFTFNADGTYSTDGSPKDDKGTYTVNEATETIILETKKEGKQEIKASFNKEGRLVLNMPSQGAGPATILELKKG